MNDFTIYPAIDLRGGKVVRLAQGDPTRQTVYGDDPAGVAQRWLVAGASWLHVVNLDGAFTGSAHQDPGGSEVAKNLLALRAILSVTADSAQVQFGGGLRSLKDLEGVLSLGVSRAILGTVAVESPNVVSEALARFGAGRIGLGIDSRDNQVRVRGWTEAADFTPIDLGIALAGYGVRTVVFTNVARDGVGSGVDVESTRRLAKATGLSVIASGGVASLEDVKAVKAAGLRGVIIGRALYTGQISLEEALKC